MVAFTGRQFKSSIYLLTGASAFVIVCNRYELAKPSATDAVCCVGKTLVLLRVFDLIRDILNSYPSLCGPLYWWKHSTNNFARGFLLSIS